MLLPCVVVFGQSEKPLHTLSFDVYEQTPVETTIYVDNDRIASQKLVKSDSVRLVAGVRGAGVHVGDKYDFLALPESADVSAEEGAISFWFKPDAVEPSSNKQILTIAFEEGKFVLLGGAALGVQDQEQGWKYSPQFPGVEHWQPGEWHHIVINWSAKSRMRQTFVDGQASPAVEYISPKGSGRIYLSTLSADSGGASPVGGTFDELNIFSKPLEADEITSLYEDGLRAINENASATELKVSTYPNLAKNSHVTFTPLPNYVNHGDNNWTCNGPDDEKKLSDGYWNQAWYHVKTTVGWNEVSGVTIDYDLGALKQIGAVAINLGAGDSGVAFPRTVTFYVGATEGTLVNVGEINTKEPLPNPQYPKWHNRMVGINNINRVARFVRIIADAPALFTDEVLIVEKGAQPEYLPSNEMK